MYNLIYFKLLKWKVFGEFPKDLKKYLVIAAPHTHWHDLHMGLLLRKVTNTKINFVAKKELFIWPLGWYLKKIGGFELDRTQGQKSVDAYANLFKKNTDFILNIAPEGTRKKVVKWKTGFYYIAKLANVPIVMVAFDYENKKHIISKPFITTNDIEKDFEFMQDFFKGIKGKIVEYS
jgi:1-acyl-sn-glycerol-3-phosphate acyltransferase